MHKKTLLHPSLIALAMASAIPQAVGEEAEASAAPQALGEESDACSVEKGPCCELDWTGQGATIVKIQGDALVSQSPYVNATLGMRVKNSGRVLALDRSTAVVAFDDGCWHVVEANQMVTITDVSPCCAERIPAAAVPPPPPPVAGPALAPWVPLAAIPAVIGGVCAATDCLSGSDDPGPRRTPLSR